MILEAIDAGELGFLSMYARILRVRRGYREEETLREEEEEVDDEERRRREEGEAERVRIPIGATRWQERAEESGECWQLKVIPCIGKKSKRK